MREIDLRSYDNSPWVYYQRKAEYCVGKYSPKTVLKTDSYNEARARPKKGGVAGRISPLVESLSLLELDPDILERARKQLSSCSNISFINGDIRKLGDYGIAYDMVIDLSTLDHVPQKDLDDAVRGYGTALNENGIFLLVIWCSLSDTQEEHHYKNEGMSPQFFFSKSYLDSVLLKYFTPEEEEEKFQLDYYRNGFLCCYMLRKRNGSTGDISG